MNQYVGFHLYLQYKLKPLKDLCSSKGALTAAQIHETLNDDNQSYKDKYQLEKAQSDIFLMLLDEDSSGFIEKRELETILNNVQYYYTSIAKPDNAMHKIQKDWAVWREKLRRIRDIIFE
jgi:CRISPR/Cas system-associated protein Cas7 (RAMP superfamily)